MHVEERTGDRKVVGFGVGVGDSDERSPRAVRARGGESYWDLHLLIGDEGGGAPRRRGGKVARR